MTPRKRKVIIVLHNTDIAQMRCSPSVVSQLVELMRETLKEKLGREDQDCRALRRQYFVQYLQKEPFQQFLRICTRMRSLNCCCHNCECCATQTVFHKMDCSKNEECAFANEGNEKVSGLENMHHGQWKTGDGY